MKKLISGISNEELSGKVKKCLDCSVYFKPLAPQQELCKKCWDKKWAVLGKTQKKK